jgi:hypothetical protein
MNPRIHFEVPAYSAPDIEAVVLQSRLFRSKSMSREPIRIAIVLGGGEPFVVQFRRVCLVLQGFRQH